MKIDIDQQLDFLDRNIGQTGKYFFVVGDYSAQRQDAKGTAPPQRNRRRYSNYDILLSIKSSKRRCKVCASREDIHVHHLSYERVGSELPRDYILLCKDCHNFYHTFVRGKDPDNAYLTKLFLKGGAWWKKSAKAT